MWSSRALLLLVMMACASPSFAAWTAVGCTASSNNPQFGSTTVTQTYTGTSGHLLVIGAGGFSGTVTTTVITAPGVVLSLPLQTAASADVMIDQQWWISDGAAHTYTATALATSNMIIAICEYSNSGTISQDGVGATYNSAGSSVTSVPTTQTSAASGELAIQFSINDGGAGIFSCTGGTNHGLGPFNGVFNACDNTSITSGSVTLTTSWTGVAFPAGGTMQFFTAGGSPPPSCTPTLSLLGIGRCG